MKVLAYLLVWLCGVSIVWSENFASSSACQASYEDESVPDCNCRVESVDHAVKYFISPLLSNLVTKKFFRYFYVDLDKACPFYTEDAACMNEGCAVCACNENEIPSTWLTPEVLKRSDKNSAEFGWVSSQESEDENKLADSTLGKIDMNGQSNVNKASGSKMSSYVQHLRDTEDCDVDDWTSLSEAVEHHTSINSSAAEKGIYVNLLNNPERYTGYGGASARRVWTAISEENCFGDVNDVCLEKRVFHRLMVGLRTSISVHIAKQYLFKTQPDEDDPFSSPTERWDVNMPLFYNAVGNHPDRLHNLYFAFLFLLRAVVRAGDCLSNYPYLTGNEEEDTEVADLIARLVASKEMSAVAAAGIDGLTLQGTGESKLQEFNTLFSVEENAVEAVEECKYGFDESELFQVAGQEEAGSSSPQYDNSLFLEKQDLRDQFRNKFRNISQIMNCVTCEKCRLWGKVQILGFGTAIKILLTPEEELVASCSLKVQPTVNSVECAPQQQLSYDPTRVKKLLSRQEIIALLNTLNQFAKSIEFVANIHLENKQTAPRKDREKRSVEAAGESLEQESANKVETTVETEPVGDNLVRSEDAASGDKNSADAKEDKPPRRNDHSPWYRRFLFTLFIGFATLGLSLMLYASFPAFAKRNTPDS